MKQMHSLSRVCPVCAGELCIPERVLSGIPLVRCRNCQFVFADLPEKTALTVNSNYTSETARDYEGNRSIFDRVWFEQVVKRLTRKLGKGSVLDVGCGDCYLLEIFKRAGWECWGIDTSPWAESAAERNGITFVKGYVENCDFGGRKFDLVVSSSTLEHVYHLKRHVDALLELVVPGGMLYAFGIPNYGSASIVAGFSSFDCNMPPGHVNYPTTKTITGIFSDVSNVTIKTYGIPEFHRIYRFFVKKLKGMMSKTCAPQQQVVEASEQPVQNGSDHYCTPSGRNMKTAVVSVFVRLYYLFGRPLGLGDKLEIEVAFPE